MADCLQWLVVFLYNGGNVLVESAIEIVLLLVNDYYDTGATKGYIVKLPWGNR